MKLCSIVIARPSRFSCVEKRSWLSVSVRAAAS